MKSHLAKLNSGDVVAQKIITIQDAWLHCTFVKEIYYMDVNCQEKRHEEQTEELIFAELITNTVES